MIVSLYLILNLFQEFRKELLEISLNNHLVKVLVEKLWARNKYDVMARGYHYYKDIKEMFRNAVEKDHYLDIFREITCVRNEPYQSHNMRNTLEHMWGYFKKVASGSEKEAFFNLLSRMHSCPDTYFSLPDEVESVIAFLNEMLDTYPNSYLSQSHILNKGKTSWNTVIYKKELYRINEAFFSLNTEQIKKR
ncbi:DUF1722 domain-containing protein [Pseudalkalibacillus caeni]|uniref:DUF1722 domain-containing protein n=1 Tax=Exobacillus caeni TaxID=2574798 RepID=A0A5R9EZD5_9BACL|nr:DUF1722 domain-containing protein [Pseudalkalibacillus caeni]TLS35829.1 DUF1722 domain-containing protein [Pseudalkalibacillus caeni]